LLWACYRREAGWSRTEFAANRWTGCAATRTRAWGCSRAGAPSPGAGGRQVPAPHQAKGLGRTGARKSTPRRPALAHLLGWTSPGCLNRRSTRQGCRSPHMKIKFLGSFEGHWAEYRYARALLLWAAPVTAPTSIMPPFRQIFTRLLSLAGDRAALSCHAGAQGTGRSRIAYLGEASRHPHRLDDPACLPRVGGGRHSLQRVWTWRLPTAGLARALRACKRRTATAKARQRRGYIAVPAQRDDRHAYPQGFAGRRVPRPGERGQGDVDAAT